MTNTAKFICLFLLFLGFASSFSIRAEKMSMTNMTHSHDGLIEHIFDSSSYDPSVDEKSICGFRDHRQHSDFSPVGRLQRKGSKGGCTATMIGRTCAISAGHCSSTFEEVHFNVPPSRGYSPQLPAQEDIYFVDQESIFSVGGGQGEDYAVFRILSNEVTEQFPGDVQGHYDVSYEVPERGDIVRVTGFGTARDSERQLAQQTHTGRVVRASSVTSIISHKVDTTGGNSGSAVIDEATGKIVGIHTHGGCWVIGGSNKSTLIASVDPLIEEIESCLEWERNNLSLR